MTDCLSLVFSSLLVGNAAASVNLEKNLGHPNYHVRAATSRFFTKNSDLYFNRIRTALKNEDPEVVMRARFILDSHQNKLAKELLAKIEADYRHLPFIAGLQLIEKEVTLPSGRKFKGGHEYVAYLCECQGVTIWECSNVNYEKATSQLIWELARSGHTEQDIRLVLKRIEYYNKTAYSWLNKTHKNP